MGGCASADLSEVAPQSQQHKKRWQAATKSAPGQRGQQLQRQRRVPSKSSVAKGPRKAAAGDWGHGQLTWTSKHFQIMRGTTWYNYRQDEGILITQAFLSGQPMCDFTFRGKRYHYDFRKMIQVDCKTGDLRQIRPHPDLKQPVKPLLPPGPMVVVDVQKGEPGTIITKTDPSNEGQQLRIMVPIAAKPGSKLAVPCGKPGETLDGVVERQASYPTEASSKVEHMRSAGLHALLGIVLDSYLLVKRECIVSDALPESDDVTGIESHSTQASSTDEATLQEDDIVEEDDGDEDDEEEELPATILLGARDYDSDLSDDEEDGMITVSTGVRVLVYCQRQPSASRSCSLTNPA